MARCWARCSGATCSSFRWTIHAIGFASEWFEHNGSPADAIRHALAAEDFGRAADLVELGLVGGPLVCASGIAVLFGVIELGSAAQFIATIPEILWEASLGIWLTVKGFNPSVATSQRFRLRAA